MRLTGQHGVEGLRSGIAKKPFQTARHLAADGVLSEQEAGHSDRDDDQRPKGEHRIISKSRAEAGVFCVPACRTNGHQPDSPVNAVDGSVAWDVE
jgi:hypothetical protein